MQKGRHHPLRQANNPLPFRRDKGKEKNGVKPRKPAPPPYRPEGQKKKARTKGNKTGGRRIGNCALLNIVGSIEVRPEMHPYWGGEGNFLPRLSGGGGRGKDKQRSGGENKSRK